MMGNNEALMDELFVAGEESHDRVWQLPIYDDYFEQIKSEVADLANTGGKLAGSITAALFLSKFAENYNWAHLDIAGTAMGKRNKTYSSPGSNGAAVRLITQFIKNRVK
jgi:leucyl aminopeptidase